MSSLNSWSNWVSAHCTSAFQTSGSFWSTGQSSHLENVFIWKCMLVHYYYPCITCCNLCVWYFRTIHTLAVSLLQYISTAGYDVVNVTQSLHPAQNVTVGWYCELTCPFNNATFTLDVYGTPDTQQPCVYTLRITEVFRGDFTVSYAVLSIKVTGTRWPELKSN